MSLDLLITLDNGESKRLFISEALHPELFGPLTRWTSYKELRKISDYYKANVKFNDKDVLKFISELTDVAQRIDREKDELQKIIESLRVLKIKSLRVTGD